MEKFSLSVFTQRDYPFNFVYYDILKKYELISPRFKIVRVIFNGDDWGLMLLEEHFSSSFYAFNELKETPIFRMTNENDFDIIMKSKKIKNGVKNLSDIIKWQGKFETKIYNNKIISKKTNIPDLKTNLNLINFFKTIQEEIYFQHLNNENNLIDYLNIKNFARSMAIMLMFGDNHSTMNNNSRYYINPYTLKIEPILTDIAHSQVNEEYIKNLISDFEGSFYSSLFKIDLFQNIYYQTLLDLQKNHVLIDNRLNEICNKFGKNCFNEIEKNLLKNNLNFLIKAGNNIFSQNEDKNDLDKKLNFSTKNELNLIKKKIHFRSYFDGSIDLINLTSEFININRIKLTKNEKCNEDCNFEKSYNILVDPSLLTKPNKITFNIDHKLDNYDLLEIFYSDENSRNFSVAEKIEKKNFSFEKFNDDYLNDKNDILISDGDNLIIKKNTYNIFNPIIIPEGKNLVIEPGTILYMSKNTYIFILNGNLKILGDKKNNIIIQSKNDEIWNGIFVRSENKDLSKSIIKHALIKNYSYFDNSLIQLTGGINFYNTKVNIQNLDLANILAEDGLNIVNSNFFINNLNVDKSISDAVDIDFSEGNIKNSKFSNIDGDALDFSGSKSDISKVTIDGVKDKAISAGEKSIITLKDIDISNSSIGIASKDSSKLFGENVTLINCILHDYAVFKKKSFFSEGFIELNNSKGCDKELVEENSFLSVNGNVFKGRKIDIKKEYY